MSTTVNIQVAFSFHIHTALVNWPPASLLLISSVTQLGRGGRSLPAGHGCCSRPVASAAANTAWLRTPLLPASPALLQWEGRMSGCCPLPSENQCPLQPGHVFRLQMSSGSRESGLEQAQRNKDGMGCWRASGGIFPPENWLQGSCQGCCTEVASFSMSFSLPSKRSSSSSLPPSLAALGLPLAHGHPKDINPKQNPSWAQIPTVLGRRSISTCKMKQRKGSSLFFCKGQMTAGDTQRVIYASLNLSVGKEDVPEIINIYLCLQYKPNV